MKASPVQFAILAVIATAATHANSAPILELTVTPGATSTTIVLNVSNDAGERPEILGFHIYREELRGLWDGGCHPAVRVNDELLPRSLGNSTYSFQVEDDALPAGHAYRYRVDGDPLFVSPWSWDIGFNTEKSWVALTVGQTMIAESATVTERDGVLTLNPCGCYAWVRRVASAPSGIVDAGVTLKFFGTIRPRTDAERFELVVDSALPLDCQDFAVVPSAWGTVKSLYR